MEIIEADRLSKEFRTFKKEAGILSSLTSLIRRDFVAVNALCGISFTVEKGEIRGFIGPNGAGKSTTIKILSGILYPTSGEVRVAGYSPWKDRERYVKNIGVIFGQKQQLNLDLPAIDTFNLNRVLYEIPRGRYDANLSYFIKLLSLEEIIKRPVRQLSLGEKMKCGLLSALLHEPKVVFLDEPTIGLDIISKEKIREFIKKVNREKGTTFLLTTHDLDDIEDLCEKVLIINKGTIVFDGRLAAIKDQVLHTKILDIKFGSDIKKIRFPAGIRVISKDGFEMKIEIDKEKHKVENVLSRLMRDYSINDINISNPDIESVIKRIFEK